MRTQAEVTDAPDVGGRLAGEGPSWCELASRLRSRDPARLVMRTRFRAFGPGMGTASAARPSQAPGQLVPVDGELSTLNSSRPRAPS
jgi:hypothetical protein